MDAENMDAEDKDALEDSFNQKMRRLLKIWTLKIWTQKIKMHWKIHSIKIFLMRFLNLMMLKKSLRKEVQVTAKSLIVQFNQHQRKFHQQRKLKKNPQCQRKLQKNPQVLPKQMLRQQQFN